MVYLIDDQQTEAVEASARHGCRVEGDNGQVAHLAPATTYNADRVPWQAELLAHGALPLRQQLDGRYHNQCSQRQALNGHERYYRLPGPGRQHHHTTPVVLQPSSQSLDLVAARHER